MIPDNRARLHHIIPPADIFHVQVFLLNLYIALVYGLLYIWFESFAIVSLRILDRNMAGSD